MILFVVAVVSGLMTLITGVPGSGKTEALVHRALAAVGKKAVLIADGQASLSLRTMMYLTGRLGHVIYIRIRDLLRTLGFINIKRFTNPNILERMRDDRNERMKIASLFLGRRALDPTTSPLIWEWLEWGLRLIQYSGAPLYFLPFCFQPHRNEFHWMLTKVDDTDTFMKFFPVGKWSPTQIRQELSASLRVCETVCQDPAFIGAVGSFDLESLFRDKKTIIIEGEGADRETVRTIILFMLLLALRFAKKYPTAILVDEIENFDLAIPPYLDALNTHRKYGTDITSGTQGLLGMEEAVRHKLIQGCPRREYFCQGPEMAKLAAQDIGTPRMDRKEIHYEECRDRQVHDGYKEFDEHYLSQYAEKREWTTHYMSLSDQVKEYERELMTLPVGMRYVNHFGKVSLESLTLFKEPLPWGLSHLRVEQAIREIQSRPEYQVPQIKSVEPVLNLSLDSSVRSSGRRQAKYNKPAGSPATKQPGGTSTNGRGKRKSRV